MYIFNYFIVGLKESKTYIQINKNMNKKEQLIYHYRQLHLYNKNRILKRLDFLRLYLKIFMELCHRAVS